MSCSTSSPVSLQDVMGHSKTLNNLTSKHHGRGHGEGRKVTNSTWSPGNQDVMGHSKTFNNLTSKHHGRGHGEGRAAHRHL